MLSGTFSQLASYTGFAIVLFAGIAVAGLFVLRWREPDAPRPFRAWGYPLAPALFTAMSAAMVVNAVWRDPGPSAAGLVVIGCGVPIYYPAPRSIGGVLTAGRARLSRADGRAPAIATGPAFGYSAGVLHYGH